MKRLAFTAALAAVTVSVPAGVVAQQAPSLAGAIYRGDASGPGSNARVAKAIAAAGYQVYVRARNESKWTGPVLTDTYGRFIFASLPAGQYQLRIYQGPVRVWEQIVSVPSVLARIIARDLTVVYFPKAADAGRVEGVLETLSFPYEHRTAVNEEATNSVWFGDEVGLDDVKSLASALIKANIPIRAIRHFHDGSGPKAKVIQVGADVDRKNDPIFTMKRIQDARNFPISD